MDTDKRAGASAAPIPGDGPVRDEPPEVVLREQFMIDATEPVPVAIPELLVLGNRAGFRALAAFFAGLADREPRTSDDPAGDPDDHGHVDFRFTPEINQALSDQVEVRVGHLTRENRAAVLAAYGIDGGAASHGSLVGRYAGLIERARRYEERP
ncbi:MAG: hypothetical protein JWO31_1197 [Phycisphaerales bacterium]|nr:hypothetical protein [Phycisphaerales bacterium]